MTASATHAAQRKPGVGMDLRLQDPVRDRCRSRDWAPELSRLVEHAAYPSPLVSSYRICVDSSSFTETSSALERRPPGDKSERGARVARDYGAGNS